MAATVAHEINGPLEAIGNVLFLLRQSAGLSLEGEKYMDIATAELERVSEIVRLTLGTQRGDAQQPVPVRITELIENVLTLYLTRTVELGIQVVRRYADESTLAGFPVELQQVFANLIVNAIDAMSGGGDTLVVGVHRSRNPQTGEAGMRVSILDNGNGIDAENRARLFEPFFTTKGERGTGIGLWVSRTIVEKHGGTMSVHSSTRPHRSGTCFSIFLPFGLQAALIKAA
jgi:two-component system NtrC family sensor kinase